MGIQNFPAVLQPIIQQGFLEREFRAGVAPRAVFRLCADRKDTSFGIGEQIDWTDMDQDGLVTETAAVNINHYAAIIDLNVVVTRMGIASQFLQNTFTSGEGAGRSLDELAGNAFKVGFLADPKATLRPNGKKKLADLEAGDILTVGRLLDAVSRLRVMNAPEVDGAYNCYLDPTSARQLFADPDFKQLFQGATSANQVFRAGMTNQFLGLRFMPTTQLSVTPHPAVAGCVVRSVIISGAGALIEADFAGMTADGCLPKNALVRVVDDIAMVTREPSVNQLQETIAQSWYWIGGFGPRLTADGKFRRAVCIEHAS